MNEPTDGARRPSDEPAGEDEHDPREDSLASHGADEDDDETLDAEAAGTPRPRAERVATPPAPPVRFEDVVSGVFDAEEEAPEGEAEETAAAIPNFRAWITSEFDHNGLRVEGERIFTRLLDLVRGRI